MDSKFPKPENAERLWDLFLLALVTLDQEQGATGFLGTFFLFEYAIIDEAFLDSIPGHGVSEMTDDCVLDMQKDLVRRGFMVQGGRGYQYVTTPALQHVNKYFEKHISAEEKAQVHLYNSLKLRSDAMKN